MSRNTNPFKMKHTLLFLALILVIGSIAITATACKKETITTEDGELIIEDVVVGDGDEAQTGDMVSVH